MRIRPETPEDFRRIHDFVKQAFATAKVCDGDEQEYVENLRAGDAYIPELALVAEVAGRIIGHVMLTRLAVRGEGGAAHPGLLLGPLAVALEHRSRGVGSALVREGFRRAVALGYTAVFLVGDSAYYGRFGFRPAVQFGIKNDSAIPDEEALVCELVPDALKGVTGTVTFEGF